MHFKIKSLLFRVREQRLALSQITEETKGTSQWPGTRFQKAIPEGILNPRSRRQWELCSCPPSLRVGHWEQHGVSEASKNREHGFSLILPCSVSSHTSFWSLTSSCLFCVFCNDLHDKHPVSSTHANFPLNETYILISVSLMIKVTAKQCLLPTLQLGRSWASFYFTLASILP